ncbi:MAG: hypothetical protein WCO57_04580 [Verrucomicrobiota bacterium]
MNTMPDEATLARWLNDELEGAELATFEAAIHGNADYLAQRKDLRGLRTTLAATLPAVLDPPYPEFFNHRIAKAIRELTSNTAAQRPSVFFRHAWWMPATAAAGMALAFWVGTKTGTVTHGVTLAHSTPAPLMVQAPAVYTPEHGVDAEWISGTDAAATVIVLEGVDAIPDALDFSDTAALKRTRDATAQWLTTPNMEML